MNKKYFTLQKKLIIVFLLLGVLPSLIVGFAGYAIGAKILMENAQASILTNLNQNAKYFDLIFDEIYNSTVVMSADEELIELLNAGKPDSYSKLLANNRKLSFLMKKHLASSSTIYSAHIITDYFTYTLNPNIQFSADFSNFQKELDDTTTSNNALVWTDAWNGVSQANTEVNFFSALRLLTTLSVPKIDGGLTSSGQPHSISSTLVLFFRCDVFDKLIANSLSYPNSKYLIINQTGNIIYSSDKSFLPVGTFLQYSDATKTDILSKNLVCSTKMQSTQWTIVEIVPTQEIVKDMSVMQKISIFFAVVMSAVAIAFAIAASSGIAKPITKLMQGIKKTGDGNFSHPVKIKGNSEFAMLGMQFNEMNERIRLLIEENYERLLHEKESEVVALNMQLNPHFLYNTLATINWIAIEHDDKEIGQMIISLCDILHYAASGLEQTVLFSDDVDWLERYLFIMKKRFEQKFTVEMQLAPECMNVRVPKLFLQPFIENAILHGFKNMENGGILKIHSYLENQNAIFVISDNGEGMPQDLCESIQNKTAGNIGTQNTIRRVQLIYGDNATFNISCDKIGVCVKFVFPLS